MPKLELDKKKWRNANAPNVNLDKKKTCLEYLTWTLTHEKIYHRICWSRMNPLRMERKNLLHMKNGAVFVTSVKKKTVYVKTFSHWISTSIEAKLLDMHKLGLA